MKFPFAHGKVCVIFKFSMLRRLVLEIARTFLNRRDVPSEAHIHRNFGVYVNTIVFAWKSLNTASERAVLGRTRILDVLEALYFLRRYPKE